MKGILVFLMFFGLSHFAIAGEECSNESGGICSEDFSVSNLDLDDDDLSELDPSGTLEEQDLAEKVNQYRCISVNSKTQLFGVGLSQNYWISIRQAYNRCLRMSGRFGSFCERPTCRRIHFPAPGPDPGPGWPWPGPGPF